MDMGKKWLRSYAEELRAQGKTRAEVYRLCLAEFSGTPYKLGKASIDVSDCSGSVSEALSAATGSELRLNCSWFRIAHFTRVVAEGSLFALSEALDAIDVQTASGQDDTVYALFFIDREGNAVHVCGYMGQAAFMNVSSREKNGGHRRALSQLAALYSDCYMELRSMTV